MKKTLALLMSLALMLTCISGFAINSSAATLEWVEESYSYQAALEDVGTHGDGEVEMDEVTGSYDYNDGFLLANGLWTYEYWDPENETFEPMTAYFKEKQEGWLHGGWSNIYTTFADSVWASSGFTYCSIMSNGKTLHPGKTAGAAVTFIVPVSGTISYDASIYAYGDTNTSDKETGGDYVTLWVNDEQVFPAPSDDPEISRIFYDTTSPSEPFEVSYSSFKVNEGDKIRLCVTAAGGTNGSKGTTLVDMPTVTYHEAAVPIGDPNGTPPANVMTERAEDDTVTDTVVTWDPAKNAAGYNVYVNGEKVNDELITECTYTVTGLESSTLYELAVTTVLASGVESAQSDPQSFKTRKVEGAKAPATDTSSAGTDAPATTDTGVVEEPKTEASFPWWIIVVAAVAVVAIVVVLVLVLGKKKKPAEAAASEEAAPAEEEKKDAE